MGGYQRGQETVGDTEGERMSTESLSLTVNGERRVFTAADFPSTLLSLIELLNMNAAVIVAEVDGEIAERGSFSEIPLSSGMSVELIRFVGGG